MSLSPLESSIASEPDHCEHWEHEKPDSNWQIPKLGHIAHWSVFENMDTFSVSKIQSADPVCNNCYHPPNMWRIITSCLCCHISAVEIVEQWIRGVYCGTISTAVTTKRPCHEKPPVVISPSARGKYLYHQGMEIWPGSPNGCFFFSWRMMTIMIAMMNSVHWTLCSERKQQVE